MKNEAYYKDYVNFMNDIMSRGDAEKVPENKIDSSPAWFFFHTMEFIIHKSQE